MNAQENDESLLVDFCLRQLDEGTASEVRKRIQRDGGFRALYANISNSFGALKLLPELEAPEDLVGRALARIRQARRTDALIAREEIGRGSSRPTFSLREAMVMAASLLIVAFLFIPSVRQARRSGQINQCSSNIGQIGSGLLSYASSNNGHLPRATGLTNRWLPGNDGVTSNSSALFKLILGRYATPAVFICPGAATNQSFHEEPKGMSDFPSGQNIQYSYQHTIGPRGLSFNDPALADVKAAMVILGDGTPLYHNGGFDARQANTAASENHGKTGQNVLYIDMHVRWAREPSAGVNGNNIYVAEGVYDYRGDETPVSPTDTFLLPAYSARE